MLKKEVLKIKMRINNKTTKSIFFVISLIAIVAILSCISGCSGTVQNLRDPDFTVGCKVVEAETKLGYFNQEGAAVVCKLKCSPDLPKDFFYTYNNTRTGCSVKVGNLND